MDRQIRDKRARGTAPPVCKMRGKGSPQLREGRDRFLLHSELQKPPWGRQRNEIPRNSLPPRSLSSWDQAVPGLLTSLQESVVRLRLKGPGWLWLCSNAGSTRAFIFFSLDSHDWYSFKNMQTHACISWDHSNSLLPRNHVSWPPLSACRAISGQCHTAGERAEVKKPAGNHHGNPAQSKGLLERKICNWNFTHKHI